MQNEDIVVKDRQYRKGYSDGFRKAWQYQEQFIRILQQQLDNVKVNSTKWDSVSPLPRKDFKSWQALAKKYTGELTV